MKFYHHPISTYSLKAHAALLEKEIEFEAVIVNLGDTVAHDEYRQIYPLGKVPVLEQADGHLIPESTIIIEYLDDRYVEGQRLIPEDPELARQVRLYDRQFDLYLNNPRTSLLFEHRKPPEKRNEKHMAQWSHYVALTHQQLERDITEKEWIVGDDFTMADLAATAGLMYAQTVMPIDDYPAIGAYWNRLQQRPSIAKVLEKTWPAYKAFMKATR